MDNNSGTTSCTARCWRMALLVGALAAVLLMLLGGWTFLQGVFAGLVIFVVVGALSSWKLCKPLPESSSVTSGTVKPVAAADTAAGTVVSSAPVADTPSPAPETKSPEAETETPSPAAPGPAAEVALAVVPGPKVLPTVALPGQAELAARKGSWKYEGNAAAAPAAKPAAVAAPTAAATPESGEAQPETLSAARDGGADDLKRIKGVGPKLEQTLNDLGFYHFDQVAAWTEAEIAWVDSRLKFKGRIERDGWLDQAKILAAGGETEFSKRKS